MVSDWWEWKGAWLLKKWRRVHLLLFSAKFLEKTRDEWCETFKDLDACVSPVLSLEEAPKFEHNLHGKSFIEGAPAPAPKLSESPATPNSSKRAPRRGEHTEAVLLKVGYTREEIDRLEGDGIVERYRASSL